MQNRKLESGNPNPGNLGSDFGRLGISLWDEMKRRDARTMGRLRKLESLAKWRNAIAHQDFGGVAELDLGRGRLHLHLSDVSEWRSACNALAASIDQVVMRHLARLVGSTQLP
jgi:hypothetical protein